MRISTWFLIPIQSLMLAEGTLLNCRLTTQLEVRFMLQFKCSDDSPGWGASCIVAPKFPIHLCYLGIRWLCQTRHSCVQWCIHGHIHPDCMQESMQNEKGGSKVAKKSHIYIWYVHRFEVNISNAIILAPLNRSTYCNHFQTLLPVATYLNHSDMRLALWISVLNKMRHLDPTR